LIIWQKNWSGVGKYIPVEGILMVLSVWSASSTALILKVQGCCHRKEFWKYFERRKVKHKRDESYVAMFDMNDD